VKTTRLHQCRCGHPLLPPATFSLLSQEGAQLGQGSPATLSHFALCNLPGPPRICSARLLRSAPLHQERLDDTPGPPADFCDTAASSPERSYLCFRRSREGNPITGVMLLKPPAVVPVGFTGRATTSQPFTISFWPIANDWPISTRSGRRH
jgi:hypothetical protein